MATRVINFPTGSNCGHCPWTKTCVAGTDREHDSGLCAMSLSAPVKRGQHIIHQGDSLNCFYVLRSGSAKSYLDSNDGFEQVVEFHYPGELLGIDALADGIHKTSVVALETAAICRIPYGVSVDGHNHQRQQRSRVLTAAAEQLNEKNMHILSLGQKNAAARFADFLLGLSSRFARRGCSRREFVLSMPRHDIANYLSLAVETVSRLLSDFQASGVMEVNRRDVRILDIDALTAIADGQRVNEQRQQRSA